MTIKRIDVGVQTIKDDVRDIKLGMEKKGNVITLHNGVTGDVVGDVLTCDVAMILYAPLMVRAHARPQLSYDGGSTWVPVNARDMRTGTVFRTIHHAGVYAIDTNGATHFRCPVTTTNVGKATIKAVTSSVMPTIFAPRYVPFSSRKPSPLRPDVSIIEVAPNFNLDGMGPDGTLYGVTGNSFRKCGPNGGNSTEIFKLVDGTAQYIRHLEDDTLLMTDTIGGVWKSGLDGSDVTKVLQMPNGVLGKRASYFGEWKNVIILGEYGDRTLEDNPRRIWLSRDYGNTWDLIWEPEPRSIYHVHGVTFDPYESIIWVCTGDIQNSNVMWSKDWGMTWNYVFEFGEAPSQFMEAVPLPNCVIFTPDSRHVAFYRWNRPSAGIESEPSVILEPAYTDWIRSAGYEVMATRGTTTFGESATAYLGWLQNNTSLYHHSVIWATQNGHDFYPIYDSGFIPQGDVGWHGIKRIVGPNPDGFLVADVSDIGFIKIAPQDWK